VTPGGSVLQEVTLRPPERILWEERKVFQIKLKGGEVPLGSILYESDDEGGLTLTRDPKAITSLLFRMGLTRENFIAEPQKSS